MSPDCKPRSVANLAGPALIRDRRRGVVYVASSTRLLDGAVAFRGRLRTRTLAGEIIRPEHDRSLPLRDAEIVWLDEPAQVAA